MAMPELPRNITDPAHDTQRDGDRDKKPVHSTHRGRLPEGHEDRRPTIQEPDGWLRYDE